MLRVWLSLLLLAALLFAAQADLPIHCIHRQAVGTWVFKFTAADQDSDVSCGHPQPDTHKHHFDKDQPKFNWAETWKIELSDPNIATNKKTGDKGTWTFVYDEGFEVQIAGRTMFAFFKYKPKRDGELDSTEARDYISFCGQTLVGWFHDASMQHWGCYRGRKKGESGAKSFLEVGASRGLAAHLRSREHPNVVTQAAPLPDKMFEPDYAFIERVNADSASTWHAAMHQPFLGKKLEEMAQLLGKRRFLRRSSRGASLVQLDTRADEQKYRGLPKEWDWRRVQRPGSKECVDYISPVRNQGSCGSCYAMAGIYVAEARLRILTENADKTQLSPQHVVSCSRTNQGCDGGYPFLVAKHGTEYGFVPDSFLKYKQSNGRCPRTRRPTSVYHATDYHYIGGYYGGCSEEAMMREIYDHGPIMVAMQAPSSLFYYSGGVYTGAHPKHEGPNLPGLRMWEQTNHALACVGWGVDEKTGTKFWIIKNTWSDTWGEHGYFRIRRGTDECGVESMASTFAMHKANEHNFFHPELKPSEGCSADHCSNKKTVEAEEKKSEGHDHDHPDDLMFDDKEEEVGSSKYKAAPGAVVSPVALDNDFRMP